MYLCTKVEEASVMWSDLTRHAILLELVIILTDSFSSSLILACDDMFSNLTIYQILLDIFQLSVLMMIFDTMVTVKFRLLTQQK